MELGQKIIVIIQMMHHAVAELSGEYFAFLWPFYDEYRRGFRLIGTVQQIIGQLLDVSFQLALEMLHVWFVALMSLCQLESCM